MGLKLYKPCLFLQFSFLAIAPPILRQHSMTIITRKRFLTYTYGVVTALCMYINGYDACKLKNTVPSNSKALTYTMNHYY